MCLLQQVQYRMVFIFGYDEYLDRHWVIIAKNVTDTGYDCIHQLTTIGCLTDIYIMNNTLIDGFHGVYLAGPSKGILM